MEYKIQDFPEMTIQGISTRTDNQEGIQTIPQLWEKFFKEDILSQINNKINESSVFAIYTDYENDENGKYSFIIGSQTNSSNDQTKLVNVEVPNQKYAIFSASSKDKVVDAWQEIWQSDLKRSFNIDFEQYNLTTDEVKIFVGLKP